MSGQEYFITHLVEIESNPIAHASFQKMMVRQAIGRQLRFIPLHQVTTVANFSKMGHGYLKHHEHCLGEAAARLCGESSQV